MFQNMSSRERDAVKMLTKPSVHSYILTMFPIPRWLTLSHQNGAHIHVRFSARRIYN